VLEGWDAAGKSGAIQRLIEKLDPRWLQVWPIDRSSPEERGRHYLWRFWQRLPPPGQIAIFDRSWYGRVLVERVEGLARPKEWRRALTKSTPSKRCSSMMFGQAERRPLFAAMGEMRVERRVVARGRGEMSVRIGGWRRYRRR